MSRANHKDFAAGVMYLCIGLSFAIGAASYRMGTPASMGPGYFPFWLGVLLALIGLAVAGLSLRRTRDEDKLERWDLRRLILIVGSGAVFGLLLRPLGLALATVSLVLISSFASHEFRWRTTILNTVVLAAGAILLFVYALGMSFPVLPNFLR